MLERPDQRSLVHFSGIATSCSSKVGAPCDLATVLRSRADPKMKQIAFVRELRNSAVPESGKVHHFWKVIVGLDIKVQAYNAGPGKHEMPGVG